MLDLNDVKVLISAYKYIERTCQAIDNFIFKHAINYGPDPEISSTENVLNHIIDLMERKNSLINLKQIIDENIKSMPVLDRQILIIKMKYRTSIKNLQAILKIASERTTFRRIGNAINNFMLKLEKSGHAEYIKSMLESENLFINFKRTVASATL
ncbi:MAG: hypothetical protein IJX26_00915 [Clostridia bacterium]|nr:hypothetical protein [Clostridia bacterium]